MCLLFSFLNYHMFALELIMNTLIHEIKKLSYNKGFYTVLYLIFAIHFSILWFPYCNLLYFASLNIQDFLQTLG